jgi:N-acetyltransferase 10
MKIKVDTRIHTLIQNVVKLKERGLFVIVGDRGRDRVVDLHLLLSKVQVKLRPSVLWCYKSELGFSTHKQKRMKQINRLKQKGNWDSNTDDPFELFISSTEIRWTYYKDSHKILGNTFGMCVLQDFESITPNLLCRTIETVEGGGLVIILLRTMSSLKQLYAMAMDVHDRLRTTAHDVIEPRFNERFILSLTVCRNCLVLDDEFNILKITNQPVAPVENVEIPEQAELQQLKESLENNEPVGSLLAIAKTLDQGRTILSTVNALLDRGNLVFSVTAARGRGKSAAMGLSVAAAVYSGYSNILVTAPSPENLHAFFEFLRKGLEALGYLEHKDFEILKGTGDLKLCIVKINIFKKHRQTIQYITVNSPIVQCDLLIIDEAAAIPLPLVQKLLGPYPILLSSTVHGYEGTGRALSLKLLQNLKGKQLNQLKMETPIRYSQGDPVEKWLSDLLCLEATIPVPLKTAPPHPSQCTLFKVERDTLFSFHRASELFLHQMMSLFVSSHYKNTPNDLQLMSDAPAHSLYVLLGPIDSSVGGLPDVLCAIQLSLEGKISRDIVREQLSRGFRNSGDLIPWTLTQFYQDSSIAELSGARVVRIATHPDCQSMGYGSKALDELIRFFKGDLFMGDGTEMGYEDIEERGENLLEETLEPRKKVKPLLKKLSEIRPEKLDYIGTSFGITPSLYKFWNKAGFDTLYIKQSASEITGEYSAIMLKPLEIDISPFLTDFKRRFLSLLSYEFSKLPSALSLSILKHQEDTQTKNTEKVKSEINLYDLKRIESYSRNLLDYHTILDMIPTISKLYFSNTLGINLSTLQQAILLAIGQQHKQFISLEAEFNLPVNQVMAMFNKLMNKVTGAIRGIYEEEIEETLPKKHITEADEPDTTKKLKSQE